MRAYTVAVAALALDVDPKWIDNVLSHHHIRGVQRKRQGIQRQIPPESLLTLAGARHLVDAIGLPISRAIELVEEARRSSGTATASPLLHLTLDLDALTTGLNERLADAVEGAAHKPRGRPTT
jgi:hypothetical protein